LRALDVGDAGGRRGQLEARERAERLRALHGKITREPTLGRRPVEYVARDRHHRGKRAPGRHKLGVRVERVGDDDLARLEARDFRTECRPVAFGHPELARRHVEEGEREHAAGLARGGARARNREEIIIAPGVEQRVFGERAGGDKAHHVTPNHALTAALLRFRRILELFAHGHAMTERYEAMEIFLRSLDRHAAHRDVASEMPATLGQHDAERAARNLGIGEEQLVEIAHPVEQQAIRMRRLDLDVLLHHRRDPAEIVGRHHVAGGIGGAAVTGRCRRRRSCAGRVFPLAAGTRKGHGRDATRSFARISALPCLRPQAGGGIEHGKVSR